MIKSTRILGLAASLMFYGFVSSATAATCTTSDLAGNWEAVLTEATDAGNGTFYCQGMKIRKNGSVAAAGNCTGNATEIKNGKASPERLKVRITGGKFKLNSDCKLDVKGSDRSFVKFAGNDKMRFARGVFNKKGDTMITAEYAFDGTWTMTWTRY